MRWIARSALALGGMLLLASSVLAHALLRQSDPAGGAVLQHAPTAVTLAFTEQPEPTLSIVHVLDSTGRRVERSPARAVPGHAAELVIPLGPLPQGVYTVTWRTVSAVDGHVTGGAFAFGVGQSPSQAPSGGPTTPPPSVGYVASRWGLYLGLGALLGAAWVWTVAFRVPPARPWFLWGAWGLCAAGVIGLGWSQASDAGVGIGQLLTTDLGRALWWRAAPIAVAGVAVAAAGRTRAPGRPVLWIAGGAAAAAMLAHVLAGHAAADAAPPWWWPNVAAQWLHFAAVGGWICGLAALLVALPGVSDEEAGRAARRFSAGASIALAVVVATGVSRAVYEVHSWQGFLSTPYGEVVDLKAALLLGLAALGAVNHYRHVPAVARTRRGLLRIGTSEVALGVIVLAVTAYLTGLAPARSGLEGAVPPTPLVADGHDFATSVRLRLETIPGTAGVNHFTARVTDYDTGRPTHASKVTLTFTKPDRPDIGPSTLDLGLRADGTYQADGTNLSLEGPWTITALVAQGLRSVEVPLSVTVRSQPETVRTIAAPGQPTLYDIDLSGGVTLGTYLDPGKPGFNEVHATFTDASGAELPIPHLATITASRPGQAPHTLPVRRFSAGHFIADATLAGGTWELEFTATPAAGGTLQAHLEVKVGP
ncbi:MAG TPA: copper resistance protein CopC [bacterium]|nr:copper resistance protein CopC [bacterium]